MSNFLNLSMYIYNNAELSWKQQASMASISRNDKA